MDESFPIVLGTESPKSRLGSRIPKSSSISFQMKARNIEVG